MRWLWLSLALCPLLACGGKSMSPAEPAATPPGQAPALDAAPDATEAPDGDAEDDGDLGQPKESKTTDRVTSAHEPATIEEAERLLASDLLQLDQLLQADELANKSCGTVCASLSSMQRSVDAICRLAGDDDDRCRRARDKLGGARDRVGRAQCDCGDAP